MKKIFIISLWICFYNMALGQVADPNAIFFKSKGKWTIPVDKCVSVSHDYDDVQFPYKWIGFVADSSRFVNAVFEGKVMLVNEYDDLCMIVIKYGNYFISYTNLSKSLVKKGDDIKTGQPIGNMGFNLGGIYRVDMQLSKSSDEIDINPWFKSYQSKLSQ